jgi:hypothetical protein
MRIILLFVAVSFLGAQKPPDQEWSKRMTDLRSVLSELLPDVISDERFNSPNNYKRIEMNAKKLADLTHDMPKGELSGDLDPSIILITGLLKDEIMLAHTHLISGHRKYAREVLRSIPRFCIACHTRSSGVLDLSSVQQNVPASLKSPLEKAEFFDATWQFDRALDEFQKIIEDPSAARDYQLDWERAIYYGISTAVRVKKDPDRALTLVNSVIHSPSVPLFLEKNARDWEASLQEWKQEAPRNFATAEELFAEARRLIARAISFQEYPDDRGADIFYLRATACLHDFLRKYSGSPLTGEALLLLGVSYETVRQPELWSLHDLYYEACITRFPRTLIAQKCYARYEQSIFFGYTGSGGMSLPLEVLKHLDEMKRLAGIP